jgi:hypothetical protein
MGGKLRGMGRKEREPPPNINPAYVCLREPQSFYRTDPPILWSNPGHAGYSAKLRGKPARSSAVSTLMSLYYVDYVDVVHAAEPVGCRLNRMMTQ